MTYADRFRDGFADATRPAGSASTCKRCSFAEQFPHWDDLVRRLLLPAELGGGRRDAGAPRTLSTEPLGRAAALAALPVADCQAAGRIPTGVFVIGDMTFRKRGGHSAGVQRQYSAAWGEKINCQIAVALHYVHAATYCPLHMRLYLPRNWLRVPQRLGVGGRAGRVPPADESGRRCTATNRRGPSGRSAGPVCGRWRRLRQHAGVPRRPGPARIVLPGGSAGGLAGLPGIRPCRAPPCRVPDWMAARRFHCASCPGPRDGDSHAAAPRSPAPAIGSGCTRSACHAPGQSVPNRQGCCGK